MKKTTSCLLILLVISSVTLAFIPSVQSQTENVKILNYSYYLDNWGNLVVVGEVQNIGSTVVTSVTVAGLATASDGTQVETGNSVWGNNLLPRQKAPFYLEFTSQSSLIGLDTSDITLKIYHATTTDQYQYQNVTITSQQGAPTSDGVYWVHGELKNIGNQIAKNVNIAATFYNSEGITVATGNLDSSIASISPGATATFDVPAWDMNQTSVSAEKVIKSFNLLVQVQSPMLTGDVPVINETSTPVPGGTIAPTNNPSGNNQVIDQTLIYAAVIVVAIVAVIAALILIRKRKPKAAAQNRALEPQKHAKKTKR